MASNSADFSNGGTYPPFGVITDDDHGSYVIVGTWIFACISVLFVVVRVVLRTWTSRNFGWDNGLIVVALVLYSGNLPTCIIIWRMLTSSYILVI